MAWTNARSADFYQRFIREHPEWFSEEQIEDAERQARLRQARLGEYSEAGV